MERLINDIEKLKIEAIQKVRNQFSDDGRNFYRGEVSAFSKIIVKLKEELINEQNGK